MLSFFPRDILDEIWDLIESVSEGFPSYFYCIIFLSDDYNYAAKYELLSREVTFTKTACTFHQFGLIFQDISDSKI